MAKRVSPEEKTWNPVEDRLAQETLMPSLAVETAPAQGPTVPPSPAPAANRVVKISDHRETAHGQVLLVKRGELKCRSNAFGNRCDRLRACRTPHPEEKKSRGSKPEFSEGAGEHGDRLTESGHRDEGVIRCVVPQAGRSKRNNSPSRT